MVLLALKHTASKSNYRQSLPTLLISAFVALTAVSSESIFAETTTFKNTDKCTTNSTFTPCPYIAGGITASQLSPEGEAGGWSTSNESSTGYNLVIGHHFKPHWFGELSYNSLGQADFKNSSSAITGTESISYNTVNFQIGYLFKEPSQEFNYYVKGGISSIQNTASSSRIPHEKQNSLLPSLGAGLQWQSTKSGLFARVGGDYFSSDALALNLMVGYKLDILNKKPSTKSALPRRHKPRVVKKPRPKPTRRVVKRTPKKQNIKRPPPLMHIISEIVKQPSFAGVLNGVDFKPNTAILTSRAENILKGVARRLKQNPRYRVALIGHTDSLGITQESLILSKSRAATVKAFLIRQGVKGRRMIAEGRGDSQPRATNSTAGGRRANQRIELRAL